MNLIPDRFMKIVIVNKSDRTGGAAVVSFRLMEALRGIGVDARMLVVEKLTDSNYVELAGSSISIKKNFIEERLKIFIANGFKKSTLFKIDTASDGLPLWDHPLIKEADAVILNWVNQGMLSLKGVRKILESGKPVVWTMHDMWCMTGICHHAAECREFHKNCEKCMLLGSGALDKKLAGEIWLRKQKLYSLKQKIKFVAVSNWLYGKGKESSLLSCQNVSVIPNAFLFKEDGKTGMEKSNDCKITIGFGAARLDDPIKGLPVLVEMTRMLKSDYPELAARMELVTFGNVRDPESLSGIAISHSYLGMVRGDDAVRKIYENTDIVVSSSSYETLPGTLVEAQAYGCIPVSFDRGGQADIIDHLSTGYIAEYSDNIHTAARHLVEGVVWAALKVDNPEEFAEIKRKMKCDVIRKFSPESVAKRYLEIIGVPADFSKP